MGITTKISDDQTYAPHHMSGQTPDAIDCENHKADKQMLDGLIDKVLSTQAELQERNLELTENRKLIETARQNYAALYDKYANLFDFAPNGYLVIDCDGIIEDTNLTAAIMLNLPKGKLTGRRMTDFVHPDDINTFQRLKDDCQRCSEVKIGELTMIRADGRQFISQIQLQAFPQRNDAHLEYRVAVVDISDRARISDSLALMNSAVEISVRAATAEQMLYDILPRIKTYTDCDRVGIVLREADDTIPVTAYAPFILEFCTSRYELCMHPNKYACYKVMYGQTDAEKDYFTPNGSFFTNNAGDFFAASPLLPQCHAREKDNNQYESIALVPIIVAQNILGIIHLADQRKNKVPLRVVEILENVGLRIGLALQQFQTQSQLHKSNMELRALSSHILRVQEDEQHRIALELHDQIGQDLNVLKLRLKTIQKKLRKDQPVLKENCTQTLNFTDKIINDIRRIAHGLNPAALENLGLGGAVRQMANELARYSRLNIEFHIAPLETVTDRDIQIGLFRIIQEALTNIYKHAYATHISITATHTSNQMIIVIQDDGIGLSAKHAHDKKQRNGMGLAAMRLRARMIGAKLAVESKAGTGTRIKVCLLFNPKKRLPGTIR